MDKIKAVIVGGGSAGWITALFIKKRWPNVDIVVIEDLNQKPIIAGESSTVPYIELLEYLNINFNEWIKFCDAVPKLGGKFVDWSLDSFFVQPLFSRYRNRFDYYNSSFGSENNLLTSLLCLGKPLDQITIAGNLIRENKLPLTRDFNFVLSPMYHFDSRKNADFFRNLAVNEIKSVNGKVVDALIQDEKVIEIKLDGGDKIKGDWFFDCSGFQQILLKKILKTNYDDFSSFIPVNSVLAWWDETSEKSFTEMTALKFGWSFDVSLRSRSGRGYVYNNQFLDVDDAINEINSRFNKKIDPVAKLSWKPESCAAPWNKNVVGIGLSTGFLEPLGSPGHTLIGLQLKDLSNYWNPHLYSHITSDQFNKKFNEYVGDTLDFICLHYLTDRQDTKFWKEDRKIPDTLQFKLEKWAAGIFVEENYPVYSLENYAAVLQANKIVDFNNIKNQTLAKDTEYLNKSQIEFNQLKTEAYYICRDCIDFKDWKEIYD